jgi:stress-induced morphogen
MGLIKKTRDILKKAFPTPDLVDVERHGMSRVRGHVISARFEGLDTFEREDLVNEAIADQLTVEEKSKIVMIFTITPEERAEYLATPFPLNGKKSRKSS